MEWSLYLHLHILPKTLSMSSDELPSPLLYQDSLPNKSKSCLLYRGVTLLLCIKLEYFFLLYLLSISPQIPVSLCTSYNTRDGDEINPSCHRRGSIDGWNETGRKHEDPCWIETDLKNSSAVGAKHGQAKIVTSNWKQANTEYSMAPLTTGNLPPCCHQCRKQKRPLTVLQILSVGSLSSPDVTTLSGVVFVLSFICTRTHRHTSRPQVALHNEQALAHRTSGICS